ncbi:type II toxin-antitoxin system PemK/MazF family toxin [Hymenobacter puniceus]|uniref:type II toxin-antitoxin system PemK/MazF family toxin n=1 Tax=Hymenobacter sp. BT190 TaxID=2763505 RepID=UPI0016510F50|nr:type II toxin-antitoxin system PemK/MazF family toxin [Hymenobacter sp. BT190]MBC6696488.1 type II toxin-antitoxin system PemK/MazF family toxin [Hymenobacter sp. BT190]
MVAIIRFEVWLVNLDPTQGSEINKTRPCVIISPNELNRHLRTVIVAALTSTRRNYPSRVSCEFQAKEGQVALDQIRSVDKTRLIRKLGMLPDTAAQEVCAVLQELFQH